MLYRQLLSLWCIQIILPVGISCKNDPVSAICILFNLSFNIRYIICASLFPVIQSQNHSAYQLRSVRYFILSVSIPFFSLYYTTTTSHKTIFLKTYISIDKRSKKARKEYYSSQRATWRQVNPATCIMPSNKAI